jgi:chromate transporter
VAAPLAPLAVAGAGADAGMLGRIFGFFLYAGSFVFGSGLAIVPFLYGGLVKERGWLTDHQFLDAVAVALITPGPVVITTGFIGYLLAGPAGASVAAASPRTSSPSCRRRTSRSTAGGRGSRPSSTG